MQVDKDGYVVVKSKRSLREEKLKLREERRAKKYNTRAACPYSECREFVHNTPVMKFITADKENDQVTVACRWCGQNFTIPLELLDEPSQKTEPPKTTTTVSEANTNLNASEQGDLLDELPDDNYWAPLRTYKHLI